MNRRRKGEGTIVERTDGRYHAAIEAGRDPKTGKRRRKYLYGQTPAAVVKRLAIANGRAAAGHVVTSQSPRVDAFLKAWYARGRTKKGKPWRATTKNNYYGALKNHLIPAFGKLRIEQLTPIRVQTWLDQLPTNDAGEVTRTAEYALATLRAALTTAERQQLIPYNAARLVTPPASRPKRPIRTLTDVEAKRFIAAAQGHPCGVIFILAISLGLRIGEVLGLSWSKIDLETGRVEVTHQVQRNNLPRHEVPPRPSVLELVPVKTERSNRILKFPAPLVALLRSHRTAQLTARLHAGGDPDPDNLVFTTDGLRVPRARRGAMVCPNYVRHEFTEFLEAQGFGHLTLHWLRHSAASLLIAQGVELAAIQQLLGHATLATTANIYGHLQPRTAATAAGIMADLFPE